MTRSYCLVLLGIWVTFDQRFIFDPIFLHFWQKIFSATCGDDSILIEPNITRLVKLPSQTRNLRQQPYHQQNLALTQFLKTWHFHNFCNPNDSNVACPFWKRPSNSSSSINDMCLCGIVLDCQCLPLFVSASHSFVDFYWKNLSHSSSSCLWNSEKD